MSTPQVATNPVVASFVDITALISQTRQKNPELAQALEKIQEFINQTSARLAKLEQPLVQNQIDVAAGLPLGYAIIQMGNTQVKFEIFGLK